MSLNTQVVDALHCAGEVLERFEKIAAEKQAAETKSAAELPVTLNALLRYGVIDNSEKEDAQRVLADPILTQRMLVKVAEQLHGLYAQQDSATDPSRVGSLVDRNGNPVKNAATQDREDKEIYIGNKTHKLKESDKEYYRHVLGYVPDDIA